MFLQSPTDLSVVLSTYVDFLLQLSACSAVQFLQRDLLLGFHSSFVKVHLTPVSMYVLLQNTHCSVVQISLHDRYIALFINEFMSASFCAGWWSDSAFRQIFSSIVWVSLQHCRRGLLYKQGQVKTSLSVSVKSLRRMSHSSMSETFGFKRIKQCVLNRKTVLLLLVSVQIVGQQVCIYSVRTD